jgi:DNA mismatch repair protein MSH2
VASIFHKLVNNQNVFFQIQLNSQLIGICLIDTDQRKIFIDEFFDDNLFSLTDRAITQSSVKEILFSTSIKGNEIIDKKMKDIAIKCGLVITEKKKSFFSLIDILRGF